MTVEIRRGPREFSDWEALLNLLYAADELKAGRALARFSDAPDKQLRMHLDWQWLTGDQSKGASEWVLEAS
jgi:hypothetical protein